ncbi:MAG: OmpA family protein [Bacteroidota bacterium]|nr:OmpA family protein [Bacteroidota bacterium]
MKRFEFLILVFFTGLSELLSQTENVKLKTADGFLSHGFFSSALPLYQDLLKFDSSNANLNFKIGVCYLNSRSQKTKAVYYLEKAILFFNHNSTREDKNILKNALWKNFNVFPNMESGEINLPNQEISILVSAYKNLGDAYHLAYKFDLAIGCYEKFKNSVRDSSIEKLMNYDIAMCRFGKTLKSLVACPLNLENDFLVRNYSSSFIPDHPPLLFNSYQYEPIELELNRDIEFFEELNVDSKTDSSQIISSTNQDEPLLNTADDSVMAYTGSEASVGTSVDGQFVLIFKVENGKGNLYTTCLMQNQWTMPEELSKTINTKGWEHDEFISADGNNLYFSSNRDGGYGGKDIYNCKRLKNGKWSNAKNLGPSINTSFDDETPFIYPDGGILYFSSNRRRVNGPFDIFTSSLSDNGSWTMPVNVGYPVNNIDVKVSTEVVQNEKKLGNENSPLISIKNNGSEERNNFIITFYNDKKASITLLKGRVVDLLGKCIKDLKITVFDNETEEILGVYYPDNITGSYSIILPAGKSINISYEAKGYLFQSEHFDISKETNYYNIHKTLEMFPVAKGAKTVFNNIFFDFEKAAMRPISNIELNKLFIFLADNPDLKIEIADYIDSKKNTKFNRQLGLSRVKAVINYLTQKGISSERITGKVYKQPKSHATTKNNFKNENSEGEPLIHRLEMRVLKIKA